MARLARANFMEVRAGVWKKATVEMPLWLSLIICRHAELWGGPEKLARANF